MWHRLKSRVAFRQLSVICLSLCVMRKAGEAQGEEEEGEGEEEEEEPQFQWCSECSAATADERRQQRRRSAAAR